jgi:hypothetical protein
MLEAGDVEVEGYVHDACPGLKRRKEVIDPKLPRAGFR